MKHLLKGFVVLVSTLFMLYMYFVYDYVEREAEVSTCDMLSACVGAFTVLVFFSIDVSQSVPSTPSLTYMEAVMILKYARVAFAVAWMASILIARHRGMQCVRALAQWLKKEPTSTPQPLPLPPQPTEQDTKPLPPHGLCGRIRITL